MSIQRYYLGCPVWSNRDWVGEFFTANAQPGDFLRQYSAVFNTVEGNTTFYGLPNATTVARWREEAVDGFQFCFKFPRIISHERRLRGAAAETQDFLKRLSPLADRLGPLFLQLPAEFGLDSLAALSDYLNTLPADFHYAVEVRHRDFFTQADAQSAFNDLLYARAIDRVILDSCAIFTASPDDPDTHEAQRKKPHLPVRVTATAKRPLLRFIGHPDVEANRRFLLPWVEQIANWINAGRAPYVFTHTPNNRFAPHLARLFHDLLKERLASVGELACWPLEIHAAQLDLF